VSQPVDEIYRNALELQKQCAWKEARAAWQSLLPSRKYGSLAQQWLAAHERLADRIVLAYYYTWFHKDSWPTSNHAGGQGMSDIHPVIGPYDSSDPATIAAHLEMAKRAKLDAFAVSWFHRPDWTETLERIIEAAPDHGIKISIDLEGEGRSLADLHAALLYYLKTHRHDDRLLRKEDKPVVLLWGTWNHPPQVWKELFDDLAAQGAEGFFLPSNQTEPEYLSVLRGLEIYLTLDLDDMEWFYQQLAAEVRAYNETEAGKLRPAQFCGTIMPGYDERAIQGREYGPGGAGWVEREDGAYYRRTFAAAMGAGADWLHVTSFNELAEHSHIEPMLEFGDFYLNLTAEFSIRFKAAVFDTLLTPPRPNNLPLGI